MIDTKKDQSLAKKLLELQRKISNYNYQKSTSKSKEDKDYWQSKITVVQNEMYEVKQEIDNL